MLLEFHASWSVSSLSSEDIAERSDNDEPEPQLTRSPAYKATRVFYRNRPERCAQETSEQASSSDGERRNEDIRPIPQRKSRTADNLTYKNARISSGRSYKSNNDHLKYNKSSKYNSERNTDTVQNRRENCSQEKRNLKTETANRKQRNGNMTNGRYNDNDKSKQRSETEQRQASLKVGRREDESSVDNMRYSKNRRTPGKWKLVQLPATLMYRQNRSSEVSSVVPPADDRRPYRRNLPPRLLARLQQTSTVSDALNDNSVSSCDSSKNSEELHETNTTTTDDRNDASDSPQHQGELHACVTKLLH